MSKPTVRVRFAPSPTGHLHVGGARTILYDYLYAKRFNGQFVVRVEDTDLERSSEESLKSMLQDIEWLGLAYDEGVDAGTMKDRGPHAPYRQSQRADIYKKLADQLISEGKAYFCFLSEEELDAQKAAAEAKGEKMQVKSPYRDKPLADAQKRIAAGEKPVIRFKTTDFTKQYILNDQVRGRVEFPSDMVGDFVLIRSNGMPVYNYCCTVDDALMKITHVFRAEEHLNNTLRQMMLYEAFNWPLPEFAHLSYVLGPDKQKLSKRHGATSVGEYKRQGYLPEAMNNYLALLGWTHPEQKEIMSMADMTSTFSIDKVHASPAVFDEVKLKWVNAQHLRSLPHETLWKLIQPFLKDEGLNIAHDAAWQNRALELLKIKMETLLDSVHLFRPLDSNQFKIQDVSKEALSWPTTKAVIQAWRDKVEAFAGDTLSTADFEAIQNQVKDAAGVKGKQLFMPIRVAVVGMPEGSELKLLVPLLEKKELLRRADLALKAT